LRNRLPADDALAAVGVLGEPAEVGAVARILAGAADGRRRLLGRGSAAAHAHPRRTGPACLDEGLVHRMAQAPVVDAVPLRLGDAFEDELAFTVDVFQGSSS